MSVPPGDVNMSPREDDDDIQMNGTSPTRAQGEEVDEEGEGDDIAPGKGLSDDSSVEEDEDEDELRKIKEGFIVDEDEDEEERDEDEERKKKKKRRKHKHRHRKHDEEEEEEEDLDEEDLELLQENLGGRIRSRHLTRLRRGRDSDSGEEATASKRKTVVESSDDDLDESNIIGARQVQDIQNIWDDERVGGRDEDDDMDMDDFIDDEDDEEDGAGAMAEEEREERRRERRRLEKERRKVLRSAPELTGIDANAWDEIHDVFGDGHDYDWALVDDEDDASTDFSLKAKTRLAQVYAPSDLKDHMVSEDDDLIRKFDIPERMQLATSTISKNVTLSFPTPLSPPECLEAALWVSERLGGAHERDYFRADGVYHHLLEQFVEAITETLKNLFSEFLEVPYIYAHRRDGITYLNEKTGVRVEFFNQADLWRIYTLGWKFRALVERRKVLSGIFDQLHVEDEYFQDHILPEIDSLDGLNDATAWLAMKYKVEKKDGFDLRFHDDEEQPEAKKHKKPGRTSAYEVTRKGLVSKLAEGFGIKPHEIAVNFKSGHNLHFVDDRDLSPAAYADQFVDPESSEAISPEELLRQARLIIATELGADPLLRKHVRKLFKEHAVVSVLPTDRGKVRIDEYNKYYNIKYLYNKPISEMLQSTQFINILSAEEDHLVTVSITVPSSEKQILQNKLAEAFASDSFSDTARAWNEERALIAQEAVEMHLLPGGVKWIREHVRDEVLDYLAKACGDALYEKINVKPYRPPAFTEEQEQMPSILAVSWGHGDPKQDLIHCVFVDVEGEYRDHFFLENLSDTNYQEQFLNSIQLRKPDVILVGGFSINTAKLSQRIKEVLNPKPADSEYAFGEEPRNTQVINIPVVYIQDEIARIYQHSKRAANEFGFLPVTGRYCIGLARYARSPLNEYAALGTDLPIMIYDEVAQMHVPQEKLLLALERALVDVVNKVGVEINKAVRDPYYASLLPFVCGFGPRKAEAAIKKIQGLDKLDGTIANRSQLVLEEILTHKIFYNAASFLRITPVHEYDEPRNSRGGVYDLSTLPDPLDNSRIHPEDYDIARQMALNAMDLDHEDVHDEHPSTIILTLRKEERIHAILEDLELNDFAKELAETAGRHLRLHLDYVRKELEKPYLDLRPNFVLPDDWDVLTMLTGETQHTLRVGLIVTVSVTRLMKKFVAVRLSSGIEGVINMEYLADEPIEDVGSVVAKGMTLNGVVIDVKVDKEKDHFSFELSSRPADVVGGDIQFRRVKADERWNHTQFERDRDVRERKKRAGVSRSRRIIKHPNFQDLNSSQAEAYLDKQHVGDVVIRPSSKGNDHLAVTWKVADQLYQHIDVVERADPSRQGTATLLVVDNKYEFADLDELIVNHVKAMSRRVEELMAHEKFKKDDDELQRFLTSFVAANPTKSIYGFTLNRRKPGHFNLSFLPKKGSPIQTWPVRVAPEAYYLFDAAAAGISELCDAFKVRYLHESQNVGSGGASGKTPYGAGRMTPARTPGHAPGYATPGHMSVRHVARTPNPYSAPIAAGAAPPSIPGSGPSSYGGSSSYTTPGTFGYQTPRPPLPPSGLNPARSAMIGNAGESGSWGGAGGGWR